MQCLKRPNQKIYLTIATLGTYQFLRVFSSFIKPLRKHRCFSLFSIFIHDLYQIHLQDLGVVLVIWRDLAFEHLINFDSNRICIVHNKRSCLANACRNLAEVNVSEVRAQSHIFVAPLKRTR
jgi:hypothetical protein